TSRSSSTRPPTTRTAHCWGSRTWHNDKDLRRAVEYLHGPFVARAGERRKLAVEQVVPRPAPRRFIDL
ncbi:MAG: hypothetical protein WD250_12505, partial [Egibacteraceae bacterium]